MSIPSTADDPATALQRAERLCGYATPFVAYELLDPSEALRVQAAHHCPDPEGALVALREADRLLEEVAVRDPSTPASASWTAARRFCPEGPISLAPIDESADGSCDVPAGVLFAWNARLEAMARATGQRGSDEFLDAHHDYFALGVLRASVGEVEVPPLPGYTLEPTSGVSRDRLVLVARDAEGFETGRVVVEIVRFLGGRPDASAPEFRDPDPVLGTTSEPPSLDDDSARRGLIGSRARSAAVRQTDGRHGETLRVAMRHVVGAVIHVSAFRVQPIPRGRFDPLDAFVRGINAPVPVDLNERLAGVGDENDWRLVRDHLDSRHAMDALIPALGVVFELADALQGEAEIAALLDSLAPERGDRGPCEEARPVPHAAAAERVHARAHGSIAFLRAGAVGLEPPTRIVMRSYAFLCRPGLRFGEIALGVHEGRLLSSEGVYFEPWSD